jgi:hypothetical protein
MIQHYQLTKGAGTVTNTTKTATLIAAPGAGKILRVTNGVVSVTVAATGTGGGEVYLRDGASGTKFFSADADAVGAYKIDFGSDQGYALTANTALVLEVASGQTADATAVCTITGYVLG